ncbi:MAG: AIR synthase-related protein, partial [Planctomycetaceae bacterium]|nr:AIR synthase-related protein [Planctomycetaceae bacterium]
CAGFIRSCHDLSEGGLAVSAAEMAFAGGLGAHIDLSKLNTLTDIDNSEVLLFSESNSRFLVEVPANFKSEFEAAMQLVPSVNLGSVTDDATLKVVAGDDTLIESNIEELREAWKSPLQF